MSLAAIGGFVGKYFTSVERTTRNWIMEVAGAEVWQNDDGKVTARSAFAGVIVHTLVLAGREMTADDWILQIQIQLTSVPSFIAGRWITMLSLGLNRASFQWDWLSSEASMESTSPLSRGLWRFQVQRSGKMMM